MDKGAGCTDGGVSDYGDVPYKLGRRHEIAPIYFKHKGYYDHRTESYQKARNQEEGKSGNSCLPIRETG